MGYSFGRSLGYLGIFVIVALASIHVTAQQSLPSSDQPKNDDEQEVLPSLFDELMGTSTLQPAEADAVAQTVPGVIPEGTRSVERQVVVETIFLTCDEADLDGLFDHFDRSRFTLAGQNDMTSGIRLDDKLRSDQAGAIALSAKIRNAPAIVGKISNIQRDSLFAWAKGTETCDIMQAPTVTMFDGTSGVVKDTSMRQFVVGLRVIEGDFTEAFQPIIRPIEEGTMLKIRASIVGDGIDLTTTIIYNEIESVELFELHATKAAGKTIQVPKCALQIIHTQARLQPDKLLLIDTGMTRDRQRRVEKAASKLPIVGRLVSHEIEIVPRRVLVMLRAVPVPER